MQTAKSPITFFSSVYQRVLAAIGLHTTVAVARDVAQVTRQIPQLPIIA